MKKTPILIFAFLCFLPINAQDTITLKNGDTIIANIIERSNTAVKYTSNDMYGKDTTSLLKLNMIHAIQYDKKTLNTLCSQNPRKNYPFGINAGIGTRMEDAIILYTVSADYLISPNISAEVNYGKGMDIVYKKFVLNYYTIGGKYWTSNKYSKSGFSGFIGLFYGGGYGSNIFEIPVGVNYIFKAGLQTSFQLCYTYHPQLRHGVPNLEFRIGWRFKLPKKKQ
ncbi:MAG: hypothetical protein ACOX7E_01450 [Paludibacter sp.]|jgi:hypothetical protein|nr:hypothetical protein [Bacteroidales bacterium]